MADLRVSQVAVETVALPTGGDLRVSQVAVETVALPTGGDLRVSQVVVETIAPVDVASQFNALLIAP